MFTLLFWDAELDAVSALFWKIGTEPTSEGTTARNPH